LKPVTQKHLNITAVALGTAVTQHDAHDTKLPTESASASSGP